MRIIPAYAGSTSLRSSVCPWGPDHPRVCGEHAVGFGMPGENVGSSPRMRGALCWLARERGSPGIIPAYAGSTCWACLGGWLSQDHPRVSGEHAIGT